MSRLEFRLERQRLFQEAFHDNIDSKGEVDALTGTEALTVDRGCPPRPESQGIPASHPAREMAANGSKARPSRSRLAARIWTRCPAPLKAPPLWSWSERSGDEPGLHRVAQGSQTGPRFPETGPPLQDMVGVLAPELAKRSSWSERIVSRLGKSRVYYTLIFSCPRTSAPW